MSVAGSSDRNPARPGAASAELTDREFVWIRAWLYSETAIELPDHKRSLVSSRLLRRVRARARVSFGDYFELLGAPDEEGERRLARDLLTTNETSFFREPKHFEFLKRQVLPGRAAGRPFRVWSAASSSGQEPYTIAMELAENLGLDVPWEILGSDISQRVLEKARAATYDIEGAKLPPEYLKKYCLRGVAEQRGLLRIQRSLRERVRFESIALHEPLPQIGRFDVVFLRNVLIYFSQTTRQQVISRIEPLLLPNGYLFVSHSETLQGIAHPLTTVQPSVYRKAA
jgi:chemotaxis protein methyltransferase CheR